MLEVPPGIAHYMIMRGESPGGIKFWVHPDSSAVFLVVPHNNQRLVDGAIKQSIDGFLFGS